MLNSFPTYSYEPSKLQTSKTWISFRLNFHDRRPLWKTYSKNGLRVSLVRAVVIAWNRDKSSKVGHGVSECSHGHMLCSFLYKKERISNLSPLFRCSTSIPASMHLDYWTTTLITKIGVLIFPLIVPSSMLIVLLSTGSGLLRLSSFTSTLKLRLRIESQLVQLSQVTPTRSAYCFSSFAISTTPSVRPWAYSISTFTSQSPVFGWSLPFHFTWRKSNRHWLIRLVVNDCGAEITFETRATWRWIEVSLIWAACRLI